MFADINVLACCWVMKTRWDLGKRLRLGDFCWVLTLCKRPASVSYATSHFSLAQHRGLLFALQRWSIWDRKYWVIKNSNFCYCTVIAIVMKNSNLGFKKQFSTLSSLRILHSYWIGLNRWGLGFDYRVFLFEELYKMKPMECYWTAF